MKRLAGLLLALPLSVAAAATAYVSDELVLGVYAEENNQGQRLATLHSGAGVETQTNSRATTPQGQSLQKRAASACSSRPVASA